MRAIILHLLVIFQYLPAQARLEIEVRYSKTADFFDLMDNVSNWWDGFTEAEYRSEWNKRIGPISAADTAFFEKYKTLRKKYYDDSDEREKDPLKNRNGLFSRIGSITSDPLAGGFYESSTMDQAYLKVGKIVSKEEVEFLKKFYAHFEVRAAVFLKESERFGKAVEKIKSALTRRVTADYFDKVSAFYGVNTHLRYDILFTWFPPIDRSNASPTGRFLIMRYNPVQHLESAEKDADIAFHEIVHVISAHQPLEQKQMITREFLEQCPLKDRLNLYAILEEPLAVVFGQALYLERFDPSRLNPEGSLYNNPWISVFAKLLTPIAKRELLSGNTIKQGFATAAGKICKELVAAAEKVAPRK